MTLAADVLDGKRRAVARALSVVENNLAGAEELLGDLYPHTGSAHLVGVTGAPGTGKSSLVNQMALTLRQQARTVGIIAVDPTSPFSGGAILGDRIRMRDLSGDDGVFIRSMATRGSLGGLARAAADAIKVLDAAGFDIILIETVGAGQGEVDIARHAHSVIVVEAPGLGDDVQAIKAGILEIADILVVNKSDDPRAPNTVKALRAMLDLGSQRSTRAMVNHHGRVMEAVQSASDSNQPAGWDVPIHTTTATDGTGIAELVNALARHRIYLIDSGELARRVRAQSASELDSLLRELLVGRLLESVDPAALAQVVEQVAARELLPFAAARMLVSELIRL